MVTRSGTNAAKMVIAGHAVESTTVHIYDGTNRESFTVSTEADGLGQLVSVVDISGATTISKTAESYSTVWNRAVPFSGRPGRCLERVMPWPGRYR